MVVDLRVEIALHDILLVVPIVCACPAAWGIGNLHQTAAVEEEPCPSAVGSMSPGAVDLVEEEAFDRFRRLISVEAAVCFFSYCSRKRGMIAQTFQELFVLLCSSHMSGLVCRSEM